jgi:hypothetical protein
MSTNDPSLQLLRAELGLSSGFPSVDTIKLGPDVMPGQWILQPCAREFLIQIQQGWGLDGASSRLAGAQVVDSIQFLARFWTASDWDAFQPLRRKYLLKPAYSVAGNKNYAIGILHPELQAIGVAAVLVKRTPVFTNTGKGLWVGIVEFSEFKPPKPTPEFSQVAIPAAAEPQPSAQDALEQEMLTHQGQIQGARG